MAKYLPMFETWPEETQYLEWDEVGRLSHAIAYYARGDEEAALAVMTGAEAQSWPFIKANIDRINDAGDQRQNASRVNGAKGGRPRKSDAAPAPEKNLTENLEKPSENLEKPNENPENLKNPKIKKNKEKEINKNKINEHHQDADADDGDDIPNVFADEQTDPFDPALSDDWVKVVKAYETNIGMMPNLGSASGSDLISYYGEMGADVLIAAIEATSRAAPSNPARYLTAILRKWSEAGVKDKDAAQAMIQDHARQTQQTQPQTRAAPAKHNPALDYMQRPASEEDFRPTSAEELKALTREMDERRKARMEGGTG